MQRSTRLPLAPLRGGAGRLLALLPLRRGVAQDLAGGGGAQREAGMQFGATRKQ
jgi:hypothetical protein